MTHLRRPNRRHAPELQALALGDTCTLTGKVRYVDARGAGLMREKVAIRDPSGIPLNVYRCAACGDFHMGHEVSA